MRKLAIVLFLAAAAANAQTVDELVQKNLAARGGAKLKALKSVTLTGSMSMGPMQAKLKVEKSRPDHFRMDLMFDGGVVVTRAFDGTTGWVKQPDQPAAVKVSGDELAAVRDQADFDGPLVDYKKKGNQIELAGKADVDGTPAYKLKLTTKGGEETIVFLDAATYLEIREEQKRKLDGQELRSETLIGGYREVDGVRFATRVESRQEMGPDSPAPVVFTIDKIDMNSSPSADEFAMPPAGKE